jgi:copper chaperone CopZ
MKKLFNTILFSLISLISLHSFGSEMNFTVKGMTCNSCANSLKKSFAKNTAIEKVEIDVDKKFVHLVIKDDSPISQQEIETLVKDAGMLAENFQAQTITK